MEYTRENPHPEVRVYTCSQTYFVGAKYDKGLRAKDIAKLLREEVKTAIKAGTLPAMKLSITTSGYRSINVTVMEIDTVVMNPERIAKEQAVGPSVHVADCHYPIFNETGKSILDTLRSMVMQYNYDRSDSQSDYFDTNFYCWPNFAGQVTRTQREAIEAELAGGNAPTLSVTMAPELDLAPVIAGPARVVAPVVNEEAARFAFFLGLD